MTIWFSSDHHFDHANSIKYANRPFASVQEMNTTLIERHNAYVKPSDHWYRLGDITMNRDNRGDGLAILQHLNGHKRLIPGNHDHYAMKHYLTWFEKVMAMQMIDNIRFTHIPIHPASLGRCLANVHGHTHEKDDYPTHLGWEGRIQPYINLSVERTDYRPLSLEEVKERIQRSIDTFKTREAKS